MASLIAFIAFGILTESKEVNNYKKNIHKVVISILIYLEKEGKTESTSKTGAEEKK